MAWLHNTKTGGLFNTEWVNKDIDLRERQLRYNAEEAYKASLQNAGSFVADNYEEELINDSAVIAAEIKGYVDTDLKNRVETLKNEASNLKSDDSLQEKYDQAIALEQELMLRLDTANKYEDKDTLVRYLQATRKLIKLMRGIEKER